MEAERHCFEQSASVVRLRRPERNLRRPTGSNFERGPQKPIPSSMTQKRREATCGGEKVVEGDEKLRAARGAGPESERGTLEARSSLHAISIFEPEIFFSSFSGGS